MCSTTVDLRVDLSSEAFQDDSRKEKRPSSHARQALGVQRKFLRSS